MAQVNIEQFVGGKIRYGVLAALASASEPLTANRIATQQGLDPAATYRYLAEYVAAGVVEPVKRGRKQTAYKMTSNIGLAAITFLRSLQQKQKNEIDFEDWMRPEKVTERQMKALEARLSDRSIAKRDRPLTPSEAEALAEQRTAGELEALAELAKMDFNRMFRRISATEYVLVQ